MVAGTDGERVASGLVPARSNSPAQITQKILAYGSQGMKRGAITL